MAETLKGACLCGRVEYEVQDPEVLGYCHCTRCQRWTGSSLAGVVVAKANFRFTAGEDLVKRYESEFAPRNFCSNCGSSLYDDLGENYFVAAGLMRELALSRASICRSPTRLPGTRSVATRPSSTRVPPPERSLGVWWRSASLSAGVGLGGLAPLAVTMVT
jgi:hypothetical protein